MSRQSNAAPVIIKRKKVVAGDGHHGGAWKVAYADFVTAMMAFFLLMWLLNATTEKQRKGIADYFTPTIPINRVSGGGDGAFGGESVFSEMVMPKQGTGATALRATEDAEARGDTGLADDGGDTAADEADFRSVEEALTGNSGESAVEPELLKHIVTRVTDEGLVIDIFALPGLPLFAAPGSDEPTALLEDLAAMLARVTRIVTNGMAVEGHVAARPVVVSDNPVWGLSARRADAMRRLMESQGLDHRRVRRVTGHADRQPFVRDPMAVRNNRLEVILLRRGR